MSYSPNTTTKQSAIGINSTITPLGSGATFTGTSELVNSPSVMVICKTDNTGTLYFDFSPDGTNWDSTFPVNGFKVASGASEFHTALKGFRYFRCRLINDTGAQSYLRLYTYYGEFGQSNLPLNQSISSDADATVSRSISDYGVEVSRGMLNDSIGVRVEARNSLVGTTEQVVWEGGTAFNFLTTAATVRIKTGGNANDTSAGSGARTVLVSGVSGTGASISETLTLLGVLPSLATTATFLRVDSAVVVTSGTYATGASGTGSNTGIISIETSGGLLLMAIQANTGRSAIATCTIPLNAKGYFRRIRCTPEGGKAVTFRLWSRKSIDTTSAPFTPKILRAEWALISNEVPFDLKYPFALDGKEEVFVTAKTATGTSAASVAFEIGVIND